VDANFAKRETFIAVGIAPEDAATLVASRREHPIVDYRQLAELQKSLGPAGARLSVGASSIVTFRATARVRLADGRLSEMRRTVAAMAKYWLPGNRFGKPPGVEIVRWYDRV
jgi:hypothetical protein